MSGIARAIFRVNRGLFLARQQLGVVKRADPIYKFERRARVWAARNADGTKGKEKEIRLRLPRRENVSA